MLEELNKFYSNIEKTKNPVIAGIDEAGRGPVIGPMVYGLYVMDINAVTNFKDSKKLTENQRNNFFKEIKNYAYISLNPIYITTHMNSESKNLNQIAKETVVFLLKELKNKCSNVQTVYIDGLGDNIAYKDYLEKYFDFKFVIENKADSKYQAVSAASIVAKVTRDSFIKEINSKISQYNIGSGYPSDPNTKIWLQKHTDLFLGFPDYVRHSWQTVKNILGEKKSKKLSNGFFLGPQ